VDCLLGYISPKAANKWPQESQLLLDNTGYFSKMLKALRRTWTSYLASIPPPDVPNPVSNKEILRELTQSETLDPGVVDAFALLAGCLTVHLNDATKQGKAKSLVRMLKVGTSPSEAFGNWLAANAGKKQKQVGVISLDWKAREEIEWQGKLLAQAHGLQMDWSYDVEGDNTWRDWEDRGDLPVSGPLRGLASALEAQGVVLFQLSQDDHLFAFGVSRTRASQVCKLCEKLSIDVTSAQSHPTI
jgi:hypothetical protein